MVTVNTSSTIRVSVASDGTPGNESSVASNISGDGRFVTFRSVSSNLTSAGNPLDGSQAYLRDTLTGTTKLVSMTYGGGTAGAGGEPFDVSDDGRFVVFLSSASDLVPNDTANATTDVFLRDTVSSTTIKISTTNDESGSGELPTMTGDGRYVLFYQSQVIKRYDTFTGDTKFASLTNGSNNAVSIFNDSSMSANGRYVTFETSDSTVVDTDGSDSNGVVDVFVRDMVQDTTTRVSLTDADGEANGSNYGGVISGNGRHVVFLSDATNLIAGGDSNNKTDVYIRDTVSNTTKLVSQTYDGLLANGNSDNADISGDGRYVVFESTASNLVFGDINGVSDIFLRDTVAGTIVRLSGGRQGADGNGASVDAHISTDGRFVTFTSNATNLTSGDGNGSADIFRISLAASEQADFLTGSNGADTILGLAGADIIKAFAGADTMDGGAGDDLFYVNNTGDKVIEAVDGGFDTIITSTNFTLSATAEVELLKVETGGITSFAAINLTGNAFVNTLIGNLSANTLDGKTGADVMQGLAGDDRYFVDTSGDVIKEASFGGFDKVYTSVGYTLKAGVQVEVLGTTNGNSTANLNLNGNEFLNAISGNAGVNMLAGFGGNDTLNGLLGNDKLTGGAGDDAFLFNTALNGTTNIDRISDFSNIEGDGDAGILSNNDLFQLENGIFTKLGAAGALSADAFKANATGTATDLDDRILYKTGTGEIFYDADGNKAGGVAAIKFASIDNFASLTGSAAPSASDFFIV